MEFVLIIIGAVLAAAIITMLIDRFRDDTSDTDDEESHTFGNSPEERRLTQEMHERMRGTQRR